MKAEYWKVHKNSIKFIKNMDSQMLQVLLNVCNDYNSNYIYIMISLEANNTIVPPFTPISYMSPDADIVNWCKKYKYEYKGIFDIKIERKQKLLKIQNLIPTNPI